MPPRHRILLASCRRRRSVLRRRPCSPPTCSPFPPDFARFKVCPDTRSAEGNVNGRSWPPASLSVSGATETQESGHREAWPRPRDEEAERRRRAGGAQGGVTRFDLARVRTRQRVAGSVARSLPNRKYFSKMTQLLENALSARMFSPGAALATTIFSALKQTGKFKELSENSK